MMDSFFENEFIKCNNEIKTNFIADINLIIEKNICDEI